MMSSNQTFASITRYQYIYVAHLWFNHTFIVVWCTTFWLVERILMVTHDSLYFVLFSGRWNCWTRKKICVYISHPAPGARGAMLGRLLENGLRAASLRRGAAERRATEHRLCVRIKSMMIARIFSFERWNCWTEKKSVCIYGNSHCNVHFTLQKVLLLIIISIL